MASRGSSSKKRSQGGGRKANSEPRAQVFRDFAGCNFQVSPREFSLGHDQEEQSDLQMNYVVIQNNVVVSGNKTLETRSNIVGIAEAPSGTELTDASVLIGDELYVGCSDGNIWHGRLGEPLSSKVELDDQTGSGHRWTSLAYADDRLVATTEQCEMWVSRPGELGRISNFRKIPDPRQPAMAAIRPIGDIKVSQGMTEDCPFRVLVAWAWIGQLGPTKCSDHLTFYASSPTSEWFPGSCVQVIGTAPKGYGVRAVEIFYSEGNASTLLLAGRTDFPAMDGGQFTFDWIGYVDATSMWPVANLLPPDENVTQGVRASRMACIDSRMYFWGDSDEPQRLWIGGNSGNSLSVAQGTGGGFVDVDPGSGYSVKVVEKYKTQSGNSIVTMLCDSPNSRREQRFNLVENTVTISNEQNMKSWQAEQVAGAVGCKSFNGAEVCEDGLYSVSRYGLALTTMTMEYNSQISTNYVSDPIKPVFTDTVDLGMKLAGSVLLEADGVLYMALGSDNGGVDDVLFCYDVGLKAWWTVTIGVDEPVIDMIHVDSESHREGIGIVTPKRILMLPTTQVDGPGDEADFDVLIQTGELSTTQPQQNWFYLSQLELCFDYIVGDLEVELTCIDQFGRRISTVKRISHAEPSYNVSEFMRVDLRMRSYRLRITGRCRFRMTHFIAKLYTMSGKQGLVWGFDDSQSFRSQGDIHPTFRDYNDIKRAIVP